MKKIILLLSFLLVALSANAQKTSKEEHRERIKTMKIAYFTQELNMSAQTAQKGGERENGEERQKMEKEGREEREKDKKKKEKRGEEEGEEMRKEK